LIDPPAHAPRERRALEREGIAEWASLARLDDRQLGRIAVRHGVSAVTLTRLRGLARLVSELELDPGQAALLLHAGVPDAASLASADAQRLWVLTGRLQRRLTGTAVAPPDLATLRRWIERARQARN
jgi:hypothetical protein